jgi:hypothetical protein
MSTTTLLTLLQVALSVLLGGVFVAAALPKLRHPKGFLLTVLEYRVLPDGISRVYARLVPSAELFAALLLFAGVGVRAATVLLALLTASFLVGVGLNLARGRSLDCGCFGAGTAKAERADSRRIGPVLLLQDVGLLAAALVVGATTPDWTGLAPWSVVRLASGQRVSPLVGGLALLATIAATLAATLAATVALEHVGARRGFKRPGRAAARARNGRRIAVGQP